MKRKNLIKYLKVKSIVCAIDDYKIELLIKQSDIARCKGKKRRRKVVILD